MSDNKNINIGLEADKFDPADANIASSEAASVAESVSTTKTHKVSSSSEIHIKFERAQKCLENAALVSKRIKEHRKATAELLGRPFEEDDIGDAASEVASTMSERTGYSVATDVSAPLSVQDALNIPGISESLANTLKQKELLMERIKKYKEIGKRPMAKSTVIPHRESTVDTKLDPKKSADKNDQLFNTLKEKENALSVMQVKMRAMETTILELQEKNNEKDQIIEAKNKATTLISDSLSKKEKDAMALLEDTRQQMVKMQENFIKMETEWKDEKQHYLKDIEKREEKIKSLEEANSILENSRFEISVENSKLIEELNLKNQEISQLEEKIQSLSMIAEDKPSDKEKDDHDEEKGSREIADMVELTKKVEILELLNCQIRQTNKELENKLTNITEAKQTSCSPIKKGSPLPARKGGRGTASKMKSPWSQLSSESLPQESDKKSPKSEISRLEMLVQSLNKEILDKEYVILQKEELITELKNSSIENKDTNVDSVDAGTLTDLHEVELADDKHKYDPSSVQVTDDFESKDKKEVIKELINAQKQMVLLNNDIEAANKNMIKVKSTHKLKLKQMQKTIDNFSKVSDSNAEIVRLNEELHQLSQKVAELEEEKGNLQLHLVDYDSGRLTESDVYKKLVEIENLAETRLKAISSLETQKFDLVQELHTLQQKNLELEDRLADISHLQSEQVSSEINSVQLEEQIDELLTSKKELELIIENLKLDKEQLCGRIKEMENEKDELNHKLESYIQENMDLTDKLEKLSAEKVSSAESIEIVESLTTQEKLELEEYNQRMISEKIEDHNSQSQKSLNDNNIEKLIEEKEDLNKKIELFSQEREEVMDKMNKINVENESLHIRIQELNDQSISLQINIEQCTNEKLELLKLNQEFTSQINELKRERIEIVKETAEFAKPIQEDITESTIADVQHEDKSTSDKGINRTKSVKQLTKEILKLKNTIKEREAEIGDCQMKILSLEEQQQKQNESLKANVDVENKLKAVVDENLQLKEELDYLKKNNTYERQILEYQKSLEMLQHEMNKLQQDYATTTSARDSRINELEKLLVEYETQIFNYGNTLQQKDKELSEYINQIKKLNDISLKLKSTIVALEEEKSKDQNSDLIKSLNKQIVAYQKKMNDNEERIRIAEDEKAQLISLKTVLENKNTAFDAELKRLQETLSEKQNALKEFQLLQQKHVEELASVKAQTKERDEEIHEVKLQLRKESIENEKLRNSLEDKENTLNDIMSKFEEAKIQLDNLITENNHINEHLVSVKTLNSELTTENNLMKEQFTTLETKNKELLEKLKKFAVNIKKKSSMYAELEQQLIDAQKNLQAKNEQQEQLSIVAETLPALQEKLKHAEEEINRLQSLKISIDQQKTQDINHLQSKVTSLEENLLMSSEEIAKLKDTISNSHKDLHFACEENTNLKTQIDVLNNKIVEYEIEQRNNANLITKISSLEADLSQKQNYIKELLNQLENYERQGQQTQFGFDAKIQERDVYIESLESEINKYKCRIGRLEESISLMEDRRHSLERKADQLGNQLQEKQKAYSEYTNQEDKLIDRLAALMDHDRVVDKQLHEIDGENKELQNKLQQTHEENQRLRKSLSDIQDYCNTLTDKASKADFAESELSKYHTKLHDLEAHLKRVTQDQQILLVQKKNEIEEIETEFNTQIENVIKEKKAFGEKCEKLNERVTYLETKLQEYKINNEHLSINLQELNQINQTLKEKSSERGAIATVDYTDQYITEINRLNAVINTKNQEVSDLVISIQELQTEHLSSISNLESKISELNYKLEDQLLKLQYANKEAADLKEANENLQRILSEKDESLKELKERQSLTFEMNIPKTEGMLISSTIEALNEAPKPFDWSSLDSQIVTDATVSQTNPTHAGKKIEEVVRKTSVSHIAADQSIEPMITAKKAYLCYQSEDDNPKETDPFNSDEGWGLGECEEIGDVTPGVSYLNEQIQKLTSDKNTIKAELEASNVKLVKALKKLKELKSANDVLSNELKISKQVSQSSFLDSAIEDELRLNIKDLENKIEEMTKDINKERKDKESLRKQNEIFNNANDRLIEMKEKLENEIELWKYKFKDANDKVSTLQWGSDTKTSPDHKQATATNITPDDNYEAEIRKIEHENDELQLMIDQLTSQNKDLLSQQTQLKNEIEKLNQEIHENKLCKNCEALESQINEIQKVEHENNELQLMIDQLTSQNKDLLSQQTQLKNEIEKLNQEIHENKLCKNCEALESQINEIQKVEHENNELQLMIDQLTSQNKDLLSQQTQLKNEVEKLNQEILQNRSVCKNCEILELQISDLNKDIEILNEKVREVDIQCNERIEKYNKLKTENERIQNDLKSEKQLVLELENKYALLEENCSQLKYKLDEAQNKAERLASAIAEANTTNDKPCSEDIPIQITDYTKQIEELNAKILNLNSENDSLLSTVTELRSSISSAVDQRGFEIAELWKQHLSQREADFQKVDLELRSQLNAAESKYEQLLDKMQSSSQEETNQMVMMEQINSLQNKIHEKEEHLRDLQNKYVEVISQLDMLRSEMQDERITHENKIFEQQEEYEKVIKDLNHKLKEQFDTYQTTLNGIRAELVSSKVNCDELSQSSSEMMEKISSLEEIIMDLKNQAQLKDREIFQKANEYSMILAQRNDEFENIRQQLIEYEKKIEELNFEKESELAVLRLKIHENSAYYERMQSDYEKEKSELSNELSAKITECIKLNKQITDLNKTLEEDSYKLSELQGALENQEIEIVTLKDEIDNLQTLLKASTSKIQKHVSFASDTKLSRDDEKGEMNQELIEAVPKAELDLALYMLHQRDVRCEELTMELTQLLEERDTLQLRLSDSLRHSEELKSKCKAAGLDESTSANIDLSDLPSFTVEREQQFVDTHRPGSRSSSMSDPDGDKPKLQAKLSELRTVRHSRDVRLRYESEQRQLDMQLMHRDVANLPPEAVEQLTQAHHTLSRDSNSTSTVLLNWLRGKSTPKVVHM